MPADLQLEGTKLCWHLDRVRAWEAGQRIAPVTIDMALTRACNFACDYCYARFQENERQVITEPVIVAFLEDCAEIGVRGVSLVSDGESTLSPVFEATILRGSRLGLSMAVGTNGLALDPDRLERILPHLTYLRVNISAGEAARYGQIMGAKAGWFERVVGNIRTMVAIKQRDRLPVTIGLQMVLRPEYADQILPLARLGQTLRPDYLVIKHCSDDEDQRLGVDYAGYSELYSTLREAERLSDDTYSVQVKWSKISSAGKRTYQRCYGPPFMLQLSGSGLVAPCGMLFNDRFKKFHLGNICDQSFRSIWQSDRYWQVMNYLASPLFNAQSTCGTLCLQHAVNGALDEHKKGQHAIPAATGVSPRHINFV